MLPLEGIRVVDLTNLLPGPFCTMILADLGAEVIKIERSPGGDPMRGAFPGVFEVINRNKKSLALNLKQAEAKDILSKLIKESDIFIEGFRPGVVKKLGFSYEKVKEINDRVIYCSISGFGQDSPYQNIPGHDINYLALSGVLSISGNPNGPPAAWGGVQVADLCSSMYAVISILAALKERDKSGKGCYIDVSMTDCLVAWMGPRIGEYYGRGKPAKDKFMGRGAYGAYQAKDGRYIAIGCVEDHFWNNLCKALGIEDMANKKEYATWVNRMERAEEINVVLRERFLTRNSEEWLELLVKADVPCSKVNSIEELNGDPHVISKNLIKQIDNYNFVTFPVNFDRMQVKKDISVLKKVGQHNEEVLSQLNFSKEEINQLRKLGAIS